MSPSADVVFDPEVIGGLVQLLSKVLRRPAAVPPEVLICSTVRNPDTYSSFKQQLGECRDEAGSLRSKGDTCWTFICSVSHVSDACAPVRSWMTDDLCPSAVIQSAMIKHTKWKQQPAPEQLLLILPH